MIAPIADWTVPVTESAMDLRVELLSLADMIDWVFAEVLDFWFVESCVVWEI